MVFFQHVVIYPDGDSGPYKCGAGIALLTSMFISFGLLSYECNKEMHVISSCE